MSVERVVPSTLKSTEATPTLSLAFAETATEEPETVLPFVGAVRETVGGIVSEVPAHPVSAGQPWGIAGYACVPHLESAVRVLTGR